MAADVVPEITTPRGSTDEDALLPYKIVSTPLGDYNKGCQGAGKNLVAMRCYNLKMERCLQPCFSYHAPHTSLKHQTSRMAAKHLMILAVCLLWTQRTNSMWIERLLTNPTDSSTKACQWPSYYGVGLIHHRSKH